MYYREVMVFVTGGATIISFLVLLTMLKTKIGEFKGKTFLRCAVLKTSLDCSDEILYYSSHIFSPKLSRSISASVSCH